VQIRQHASFHIFSERLSPAEITAQLGIEPDHFKIMGTRSSDPPRPRSHQWTITCDHPGLRVDEQIASVIDRISSHRNEISALARRLRADDPPGGAELSVVRYLNSDVGEEESDEVVELQGGQTLEKLPGQHQLLGWHLGAEVISFLHAVGAGVDVDEYG
jgi:hypothetical protein